LVTTSYPRDLVGYGPNPPKADWPGGARIAVQFVLNYEEGGENCILHGDQASEAFLSKIVSAQPLLGVRHISIEQLYEYGSRVGLWRILRLFERKQIPLTIYAVAMAAERHPRAIKAMIDAGHEIASHGYRWINYQYVAEDVKREHIRKAVEILTQVAGSRPLGGALAAPVPTPAASSRSTADFCTTRTTTTMTCPTGPWWKGNRSSSFPTPWMPTTCVSPLCKERACKPLADRVKSLSERIPAWRKRG
jgi:peptidoglycan/xylan/chitin deacetylase (PgdA/CDA1 family)